MKVRVGGVSRTIRSQADISAVETQITNAIVKGVVSEAVELTPRFLRRLAQRVQVAATLEASKIFSVISENIGKPRQAINSQNLTADDLMRGVPRSGIPAYTGYYVPWPELNYRYARRKRKRFPGSEYNMFRYSGAMQRYFGRQGPSIIRNRLGGMSVQVSEAPKGAARSLDQAPAENARIALGKVSLTMFPRLSPAMAPMLSTRRWTDAGDGAMERAVFGGTRTLEKLLNRRNSYRPLVTPTVQFFMLTRIPAAVNRSMRDYFNRTSNDGT